MNNYDISLLKSKTKSFYKDSEKNLLNVYEKKINNYSVGVIINYIVDENLYEVYSLIEDKDYIVSGMYNKLIKNSFVSKLYFSYLRLCISIKGLKFFFR